MIVKGLVAQIAIAIIKAERIKGSGTKLAKAAGVSKQRLNDYKQNRLLPYEMAVRIFIAVGGKVTLEELRPDLKSLTRGMMIIFLKQSLQKMFQFLQSSCNLFL